MVVSKELCHAAATQHIAVGPVANGYSARWMLKKSKGGVNLLCEIESGSGNRCQSMYANPPTATGTMMSSNGNAKIYYCNTLNSRRVQPQQG